MQKCKAIKRIPFHIFTGKLFLYAANYPLIRIHMRECVLCIDNFENYKLLLTALIIIIYLKSLIKTHSNVICRDGLCFIMSMSMYIIDYIIRCDHQNGKHTTNVDDDETSVIKSNKQNEL